MVAREADRQILRGSLRTRFGWIPPVLLRFLDKHAGAHRQRRPPGGRFRGRQCCVLDQGAQDLRRLRIVSHAPGEGGQAASVEEHVPDPRILPFFQSARPGARPRPEDRGRQRAALRRARDDNPEVSVPEFGDSRQIDGANDFDLR